MSITISDTSPRVQYTATSGQTTFSVPFEFFDDDDIVVINTNAGGVDTTLTKSSNPSLVTEYSVSGAGETGGGSITLGAGATLNDKYTIYRDLPIARSTDFPNSGTFPIETLNTELDKIVAMMQQNERDFNFTVKAKATTSTAYGLTFPELVANKILSVNSAGNGLIFSQEIGNFRGNWAASTAYVQRDLVKDTSNGNIYIVNTAHTSSGSQPLSSNANSSYYDLIVDAASATSSASAALASATAAAASETAAAASETAAAASESAAATSETNAATSASTASTQASNAANSASAAATSATNASNSASAAATSATNSANSATAAASSATSAAGSASTATTQASNASTSATNAATSASNAATSESNAATSESNAATSASNASTSATNASNSASAASTSATNASNSATAAATSAASAAAAYDTFDDRYLGSKTSDPTLDNDGNALVQGALYFNSSANEMRVYDGANWIAASSAGTASLIIYEYTATSGQTTFSGSDDNAASLSYSVNNLFVTLNGVVLDPDDYTATDGLSIVLGTGATTGDLLTVHAFKSFTVSELNANNLTTGTIPDARFPSVLPAVDGSNLTGITSVGGATGVDFNDNVKAQFGASNDLQIYHNGSDSFIDDAGTGSLYVRSNSVVLGKYTGEVGLVATADGSVDLYHNDIKKLETTSTGVDVTGTVTADGLSLGDNETINLGASNDLQIKHTGSNSLIADTGTGNLIVRANDLRLQSYALENNYLQADEGGEVRLYHNNVEKLATKSTGVDVTGLVNADSGNIDGDLTVDTETLYVDSSNNRVGVGISSPTRKLHVSVGNSANGNLLALQNSNAAGAFLNFVAGGTNAPAIGAIGNDIYFSADGYGGTKFIKVDGSNGHLLPVTTNTYDLGSSSLVWRNIYTSDFHMSNEGLDKGNDIDGTKGSWTFQEGEENLYLINNKNGKKYKFNLTEIE